MYSVVIKSPKQREIDRIKVERYKTPKCREEYDNPNVTMAWYLFWYILLPYFLICDCCGVAMKIGKNLRKITVVR